jgi:hypothetical protein
MKYCPEMTQEIVDNLKLGMNRTDTCDLVGICYDTFLEWMQKPDFAEAIKRAEMECKRRCIGIIQKEAVNTWQAAAWWLERKYKDEFSLKQEFNGKMEISGWLDVVKKWSKDEPAKESTTKSC